MDPDECIRWQKTYRPQLGSLNSDVNAVLKPQPRIIDNPEQAMSAKQSYMDLYLDKGLMRGQIRQIDLDTRRFRFRNFMGGDVNVVYAEDQKPKVMKAFSTGAQVWCRFTIHLASEDYLAQQLVQITFDDERF